MKLLEIKSTEITISYKTTIKISGTEYTEQQAYQLEVVTDHGTCITELILFKDFHSTSYADCLKLYSGELLNYKSWPVQVRYPIEMALFQIADKESSSGFISINGYYDPSMSNFIPSMNCIKIKIGRSELNKELGYLDKLKEKNLRLDSNQSLNIESFKQFINKLENYDYFEEPFIESCNIKDFPLERFALDENVCDEKLQELKQVTTFVIKPSLLGLDKTLWLIQRAKKLNKRVVISSTFEGETGLRGLSHLANYADKYLGHRENHGLGTISYLANELKLLRISASEDQINIHF